jgi:hypothetical protein
MTVAADPDPYFALPKLYGAPAYARAPKAMPDAERPFDPDDLPIAAEQTEDERAFTGSLRASESYRSSGNGLSPFDTGHGPALVASGVASSNGAAGVGDPASSGGASSVRGTPDVDGVEARRFSLRVLTDRLGPRPK